MHSENGTSPLPVTLIVINYNGESYLEETLQTAHDLSPPFQEILVVDNGSEDGSVTLVRDRFPDCILLALGVNKGPGAARNAGILKSSCDRILCIDNDVKLTAGCTELLNKALDSEPAAALAMPRVLYDDKKDLIQYDGADSHFLGMMQPHNADRPDNEIPINIRHLNSLITCAFLFDRRRLPNPAYFDEDFFIYFEDHDFGLRSRIAGHTILAVPEARIFHRKGTLGLSLRQTGTYTAVRVQHTIRNRWQVILKNYQCRTIFLLLPVFFLYECFQFAGVVKKGWLTHWIRAAVWMGGNLPKIMKKRRAVQCGRSIPDRAILSGGDLPFTGQLAAEALEKLALRLLQGFSAGYWKIIRPLL